MICAIVGPYTSSVNQSRAQNRSRLESPESTGISVLPFGCKPIYPHLPPLAILSDQAVIDGELFGRPDGLQVASATTL